MSIINLHSCIANALELNAPPGNPGTEVVGDLPKLVVLGDLGELEEEEATRRIRFGLNMLKRSVAGEEESEVTVICDRFYGGLPRLSFAKQCKDYSHLYEIYGGEADRVHHDEPPQDF